MMIPGFKKMLITASLSLTRFSEQDHRDNKYNFLPDITMIFPRQAIFERFSQDHQWVSVS